MRSSVASSVCQKGNSALPFAFRYFYHLKLVSKKRGENISVTGYHCHIGTNPLLVARPSADLAALKPTLYARALTIDARKIVHLPDKLMAEPTAVALVAL